MIGNIWKSPLKDGKPDLTEPWKRKIANQWSITQKFVRHTNPKCTTNCTQTHIKTHKAIKSSFAYSSKLKKKKKNLKLPHSYSSLVNILQTEDQRIVMQPSVLVSQKRNLLGHISAPYKLIISYRIRYNLVSGIKLPHCRIQKTHLTQYNLRYQ